MDQVEREREREREREVCHGDKILCWRGNVKGGNTNDPCARVLINAVSVLYAVPRAHGIACGRELRCHPVHAAAAGPGADYDWLITLLPATSSG